MLCCLLTTYCRSQGTMAPEAAGLIHTDIQKGFIKAEVMSFRDFYKKKGREEDVRSAGLLRAEGKEYIVQDGDIMFFKFKVK